MPDDVFPSDPGATPPSAGGPTPPNGAPKRRRRRRRKPLSAGQISPSVTEPLAPPPPSDYYAPPVQISDFDMVVQDAADQMEEPSPSVQAMEEAAKPFMPPSPPSAPAVDTYSAPIYQEPAYDPFADPFSDPGGYPDPMSQPIFPSDESELKASEPESLPKPQPEFQPEPLPESEQPLEGEIVSEAPVKPLAEPSGENLDELAIQGSFKERLEKLLQDANITPRQIKFCCGGLVAVFVLIMAGWFLIPRVLESGFPSFSNGDDQPEVTGDEAMDSTEESAEQSAPQNVAPEPLDTQAWVDPAVFVGLSLGNPAAILPGDTGVISGILVGEQEKLNHDFSQLQAFVSDLEALYRLYRVDLDAFLDASSNRTTTLEQHLVELRAAYNRSFANYEEILRIKDSFGDRFNTLQPQKEAAESDFFNQIRSFEGFLAEEQLLQFIDLSKTQVDFKAKYFAFGKLQIMYETILPPFKKRIEDIEYNRAALISDVQVVDVIGSDLDLIVGEEEL